MALRLARLLADPATPVDDWGAVLTIARAELLLGALAHRLEGRELPPQVARILEQARVASFQDQRLALWEAEIARRVLAPLGVPVILLKGTAYAAAGLRAGAGRSIGDLDIMVPRAALGAVEAALLDAGWEWVKPDPYDDLYYRRWMHELPPLIHRTRDRMIDVHHTILPLTATPTPDAAAMIADSVTLGDGNRVLVPMDMIVHAAAHLLADGDLSGGLRNLWDIHCLLEEFGTAGLAERARLHGLEAPVARAQRLARHLYGGGGTLSAADRLYLRRLLARDGWGRPKNGVTRLGFYVRSHWIRMPPTLLARHLWIKMQQRGSGSGPHRP